MISWSFGRWNISHVCIPAVCVQPACLELSFIHWMLNSFWHIAFLRLRLILYSDYHFKNCDFLGRAHSFQFHPHYTLHEFYTIARNTHKCIFLVFTTHMSGTVLCLDLIWWEVLPVSHVAMKQTIVSWQALKIWIAHLLILSFIRFCWFGNNN